MSSSKPVINVPIDMSVITSYCEDAQAIVDSATAILEDINEVITDIDSLATTADLESHTTDTVKHLSSDEHDSFDTATSSLEDTRSYTQIAPTEESIELSINDGEIVVISWDSITDSLTITDITVESAYASRVAEAEIWVDSTLEDKSITWPDGSETLLVSTTYYRFLIRKEPNGVTIVNLRYSYTL